MRFHYYINEIWFPSFLRGDYSPFHPLSGMPMIKFFSKIPGAENIMMFEFADCADNCLGRPSRLSITASDRLVR